MEKFDLVKLKNVTAELKKFNLKAGDHGVVLSIGGKRSKILFFNDDNIGENGFLMIDNDLLLAEQEKLPIKFVEIIQNNIDTLKELTLFSEKKFKNVDYVELIVEKERYAKFGVHKGDRGYIASAEIVLNEMLVDFTAIDKEGNLSGETIGVNVEDLKIVDD